METTRFSEQEADLPSAKNPEGWEIVPTRVQPHTELCAFVCTPQKGVGRKDNKGEEIINCQLIFDQDIIRLCMDVEGVEFQCKVVYDLGDPLDDAWWHTKLGLVNEWMDAHGVLTLFDAVACCMRRMEVPMLARLVGNAPLAPPIKVISNKPSTAFVEMMDKLKPELIQDFKAPATPPKKKSVPKREDDEPQLF